MNRNMFLTIVGLSLVNLCGGCVSSEYEEIVDPVNRVYFNYTDNSRFPLEEHFVLGKDGYILTSVLYDSDSDGYSDEMIIFSYDPNSNCVEKIYHLDKDERQLLFPEVDARNILITQLSPFEVDMHLRLPTPLSKSTEVRYKTKEYLKAKGSEVPGPGQGKKENLD